jgi:hypothetical protein
MLKPRMKIGQRKINAKKRTKSNTKKSLTLAFWATQ